MQPSLRNTSAAKTGRLASLLLAASLMATASPIGLGSALAEVKSETPAASEQAKPAATEGRGWLGVKIQNIDEDTAEILGMTGKTGALIAEVMPGSPAATADLKAADAVLSVNGTAINDGPELSKMISGMTPDASVELKLWRDGKEHTVTMKLGKFAASDAPAGPKDDQIAPAATHGRLGLQLAPASEFGSNEGVAIAKVDPSSDAASKGLKTGDIILRVDRKDVTTPESVISGVKSVRELGKKAVLLYVKSGEEMRYVSVRFG